MKIETLQEMMALCEKMKCNTRHSWTSPGRQESVAEHTYRLGMFAWLVQDEFPNLCMERVMKMCLFHDIGEALTGDVASFHKGEKERKKESDAVEEILEMLPDTHREELQLILTEIEENKTDEAKLFHALDKMEAVIQHNEAPIESWIDLEYELQLTYGQTQAQCFPYTKALREKLRLDSVEKIKREGVLNREDTGTTKPYYISTDKKKLQLSRVKQLMEQTSWGKNRSLEQCQKAVDHSICYGVYTQGDYLVGHARVVTDYVTVYYLCDVVVDEAYRGKGIGKQLIWEIVKDPELEGLYGMLHTHDMEEFYRKFGFDIYRYTRRDVFMKRNKKC